MILKSKIWPILIFLSSFGLYLFSCAPHLAPYRDAGEMVVLFQTLGVAHPPGYPFYGVLGKLITLIPLGNPAYLANVFSALFGAAAITVLFLIFKNWFDPMAALVGAVGFGLTVRFWELAAVAEMYSLGFFWLCLLLYVYFVLRNNFLFALLYGLGLGIRMDMVLFGPLFVGFSLWQQKERRWFQLGIFFLLGLTIFLYLPIRSLQDPVLDWANPEKINNFLRSVTRASYGGTLDLLSLNYGKGENFLVNMVTYFSHLKNSYGWAGCALAGLGLIFAFFKNEKLSYFWLAGFVIASPLYLFLANMPPNPHALAVVEANFPVADLFVAFFIAQGFSVIWERKKGGLIEGVLIILLISLNAKKVYAISSKRHNFYVRDYIGNVFKSVPPKSILVADKDVQIFSLWEYQVVENKRKDISLVSVGLSESGWYWDMKNRWGTMKSAPESVKTNEGWLKTKQKAGPTRLFGTHDIHFPGTGNLDFVGHGMVNEILFSGETDLSNEPHKRFDLFVNRGIYKYGETPDFFSSDLIGDHARAYHRTAYKLMRLGNFEEAINYYKKARSLDPSFARPSADLGYIYFSQNDFEKARKYNYETVEKYKKMLGLSYDYKSLPDVVNGIKNDLAQAYVSLGVTEERLGKKGLARDYYQTSIKTLPNAQAHYNLAVTYWNEDWSMVIRNLEKALELNPSLENGRNYLARARSFLK